MTLALEGLLGLESLIGWLRLQIEVRGMEWSRKIMSHDLMTEGRKHCRHPAVLICYVGLEASYLLLKCVLKFHQKGADL